MSRRRKFLLVLVGLIVLIVTLTIATPQGQTAFKASLFIPEVVPAIPVKPQAWILGQSTRREINYPIKSGLGVADLYLPPGKGNHSAVLLFRGVNPAGRDDPRVVRLAKGLARSGMVVMIPWSDTMTQKRISTDEINNLVYAFQALKRLDGVDPDRIGMGGFCVGASLAAVAAEDPRIADDVKFLNFFGGYFNAFDLVKAISARSSFYKGQVEPWNPDTLTREVFFTELISSLSDPEETALLTKIFIDDQTDLERSFLEELSKEGKAVFRLLDGAPLEETDTLISQLPEKGRMKLAIISPSTRLDKLKARVLIMQNREDNLVPVEESRRLADALSHSNQVYYTEFSFFQHVDPTKPVDPFTLVKESFKLFLHMYNILRYTT